jgi:hypothetical protein
MHAHLFVLLLMLLLWQRIVLLIDCMAAELHKK